MAQNSLKNPFSFSVVTWIALGSFLFVACLMASIMGVSLLIPLLTAFFVLLLLLLSARPLLLLGILIVVRMSLDYSAQYVTFSLGNSSFSLSQLLGIGIAGLGFFLLWIKRKDISSFPLLFPFLLLFVWGSLSLAYSIAPFTTLSELLRFFDLFVISFLAYTSIHTPRDFKSLLWALFLSSVLPVIFGIYQFTFGIGLADESVSLPRIFGTFAHPNVFSLYLFSIASLMTIALTAFIESARERLLLLSFLGLILGTLLLTYARVAWLSLVVFAFLVAFWRYKLILIPLVLFPLILFAFSQTIQERVIQSFQETPDSSIVWRKNLWHDVLLQTKLDHREVFGNGMDTFPVVSENLRGIRFGSNDPHNDFVKFFVEGGVVGLIIFIAYLLSLFAFLLTVYQKTRRHPLFHPTVVLVSFLLIGLLAASLSDNVFKNTPVQWILWATLGGLAALMKKKSRHKTH